MEKGISFEERDINKLPPSREFLEKHVDATAFLDFLSKRSPALKGRKLPGSKKEAIALMLEQPNLIRRPVLDRGGSATRSSASTRMPTPS